MKNVLHKATRDFCKFFLFPDKGSPNVKLATQIYMKSDRKANSLTKDKSLVFVQAHKTKLFGASPFSLEFEM